MTLSNARNPKSIKVELYGDLAYTKKIGETTMRLPSSGYTKEVQTYYFMDGEKHAKCSRGWVGPALTLLNSLLLSNKVGRDTCNCEIDGNGKDGCNVYMEASLSWERPMQPDVMSSQHQLKDTWKAVEDVEALGCGGGQIAARTYYGLEMQFMIDDIDPFGT